MSNTNKDFSRYQTNITISVWGRGKATAEKNDCPLPNPPGASYPGDCQDCEMFMGVSFPKGQNTVAWGERFQACCWAKINPDSVE